MVANLSIGVSVSPTMTALSFIIMRTVLKLNVRTAGLPRGVEHIITYITIICLFELRINYFHVMLSR